MNQRIRELALQADEYAEKTVHYYMGQFDGLTWEGKIKQTRDIKFAELIVMECVNRVRSRQQFATEDNQNVTQAFDLLVYDIESHFGVE